MNVRSLAILCGYAAALAAHDVSAQTRIVRPGAINSQHEQWKKEADEAYRRGEFAKCLEQAERVLSANASDDVALYLRGSARVELGIQQRDAELVRGGVTDAREAIRIVNRVKIDYYLPYLYGMSHLAEIEDRASHAETARDVATQLLAMTKLTTEEKSNIAYQRALIRIQLGDAAEALKDFELALQYNPRHLAAQLARCDVLGQTGTPDEVEAAFVQAAERFPREPYVANNRGMFYQSLGRFDEAIADFDRAISLNAEFLPAYTNRGFTRLQAGEVDAAIADFNKAIEMNPGQAGPFSLRAAARLQQGEAAAAIDDYQEAMRLDPQSPALRADLGFAQYYAGRFDAARQSFVAAQQLDPQSGFLDPWRVAALVADGRQSQAEQEFAAVIAKPAEDRNWFDKLVLLVLGKINDNDVLSAISGGEAAQEDAQRCEAFYFMGLRTALDGKTGDAEPFYRQALQAKATHLAAYRAAQFALKDFRRGIDG